jgi:hypothetical protein
MRHLFICFFLILGSFATAQDLTQNFTTEQTKHFDEQDSGQLTLNLLGVNPFYYVYSTAITSKDQALSDFDAIAKFLPNHAANVKSMAAPLVAPCEIKITNIQSDIAKMKPPTLDPKTNQYTSQTLAETQADWNTNVKSDYAALLSGVPDCSKVDGYDKIVHAHDVLFPSSSIPSVTATISAKACKDYTVTFTEYFQGVTTGKSAVSTFSTTCDQLSLSGGTLLTEIGNPTYVSRSSPTASGQFLSVENTSRFRPTITGLLNYNLPAFSSSNKWISVFRIGASTGPVFQNSQNGGSSFGWFFGGSVSLYKRLYISAGEHWGDFPDFPFGFTKGAVIPPNFGQLTPNFRSTGRFAIGITFRTNNIGQIFGGTATANTTATPNP